MYNTKFSISYLMVPNRHQKNSQYEPFGLYFIPRPGYEISRPIQKAIEVP